MKKEKRGWLMFYPRSVLVSILMFSAITLQGQTYDVLYNFAGTSVTPPDGSSPQGSVVVGPSGNILGTTSTGGMNNAGTIFEVTPSGEEKILYNFCSQPNCTDGSTPLGSLVLNGSLLYGTTYGGGPCQGGTIFRLDRSTNPPTETVLNDFCYSGAYPMGGVVQDAAGNLYTTLSHSWMDASLVNYGAIFEQASDGWAGALHIFCSQIGPYGQCLDGYYPTCGLVWDSATNMLYGTTYFGGSTNSGVVFSYNLNIPVQFNDSYRVMWNFSGISGGGDGFWPYAGLLQITPEGWLYGTTLFGGDGGGTVFAIKPAPDHGVYTLNTLYAFNTYSLGDTTATDFPMSPLIAADWNAKNPGAYYLYGTTNGASGVLPGIPPMTVDGGAIYQIKLDKTRTKAESFEIVHRFTAASGYYPIGGLFLPLNSNGWMYGTTTAGGTDECPNTSCGVVYKVYVVPPQITSFSPTSGPPGTIVTIHGFNFARTTQLRFGGVPTTSFTVNTDREMNELKVVVPRNAKTGIIRVVTQGGNAPSSQPFTVEQ